MKNLIVIKRSNKPIEALHLPVIANINPRCVFNKITDFHSFVEQEEIEVVFMSESWEREEKTLKDIITLDNFEIVSNVFQRKGRSVRPAIIGNTSF